MHVREDPGNPNTFPTRRAYAALGLGFLAFAVYGSLLPFDLDLISLESAWSQFRAAILRDPPRRLSRSDLLANFLLFVPVGFSLAGWLLIDRAVRGGLFRATIVILPISLLVSFLAEFLQTFTNGRVPSNTDVASQTLGCLGGIVLWRIIGAGLTRWLRETFSAAPGDRLSRVLGAFAAGWMFVNLAPFDITVDLGDLARRVRTGKISMLPSQASDLLSARAMWDALAEILSAAPLGAFGLIWSQRGRVAAFATGAAIVVAVEAAQIFISSHAATGTDVLFAWFGVALGVVTAARFLRHASEARPSRGQTINAPVLLGIAGWVLVLCAYHWMPYEFAIDDNEIRRKLSRISFLPFAGYRSGSDLNAFSNVLTKLALAAPVGLGVSYALRRGTSISLTVGSVALAGLIFSVVEAGQFFLPGRVPDPTDILVGMLGAYGGMQLGRWLRPRDVRFATANDRAIEFRPDTTSRRPRRH